jgi:hypothetical protein
MSLTHPGPGPTPAADDLIVPVIAIVSVTGDLHDGAAARLLRWCEGRLHLLDIGQAYVGHLLIELSHARHTSASALAILDHARAEAERRHVGIHLVDTGPIMTTPPLEVRRHLARWSTFPTLDVARATLSPRQARQADHPIQRPVDPDSIVLVPTPHDRL